MVKGKRVAVAEQTAINVTFSKSGNGQFVKRIKGKVYCFGTDEAAARKLWTVHKESLIAGRGWKSTVLSTGTLRESVNLFLTHKERQLEEREITQVRFSNLLTMWKRHVAAIGPEVEISTLNPQDFERLRDNWNDLGWQLTTIKQKTLDVIAFVKFCIEEKLITGKSLREVIGRNFKVPTTMAIMREADDLPERDHLFTAEEIKSLLNECDEQHKLALLLGINCAFKSSDVASLKTREVHISKEGSYIKNRRPKNKQPRIAPLWKETIEAYEAYLNVRPKPASEKADAFVFIVHSGEPVWRSYSNNSAAYYFKRRMQSLGIFKPGRGISHLRHTHRTISDECLDTKAAATIMGHSHGIDAVYANPKDIKFERLVAITDAVHSWLYGEKKNS